MKQCRLWFVLIVSLLWAGCVSVKRNVLPENKPVIGVILPFSSAFTPIAEEQKKAIELAVERHQVDGEVIFEDGAGDAEGAVSAYARLKEHNPTAIISCASWAATALNPVTAKDGVFHAVIGSAAFTREVARHTVRFTLDASMEEAQLAAYLEHFKRVAVYSMDNGYGNNWAKVIESSMGDRVVASLAYDPTNKDFTPGLKLIAQAKPEALVLLSAGNAALIAEQARKMGINAQLVGTRPIERPELLDAAEYTNGLVYTYPSYDRKHPALKVYEEATGDASTIFAAEAYMAASSLLDALEQVRATPAALFEWYAGRTLTGALGEIVFDREGDAVYPYMYKVIDDGQFKVAEFQFNLLLHKVQKELYHTFHEMHETLEATADELHTVDGPGVDVLLEKLHARSPGSYDCMTVSDKGIVTAVAPREYAGIIGTDISGQAHVMRLHETHEPVVSNALDTVEGFVGFVLEHPIMDERGEFIGSLNVLTEPDFFGNVIRPRVANFPVEIWMMEKDGRVVYDVNEEEVGRNIFTDQVYAQYKSLIEAARGMVASSSGETSYTFLDKKMQRPVRKRLLWTTVDMHGTEFRVALSYVPAEL